MKLVFIVVAFSLKEKSSKVQLTKIVFYSYDNSHECFFFKDEDKFVIPLFKLSLVQFQLLPILSLCFDNNFLPTPRHLKLL